MRIGLLTLIIITMLPHLVGAADRVHDKINQLIKQSDPNLNIGIKITNLDQGKVIFEKNADRYFIPASTLKFVTIVSILEHFDINYNFTSNLLHKNQDYYFDIHDPDFGVNDLEYFVVELAKHSGKNIIGNIYILDNKFAVPAIIRDKTISDSVYCYGAPVTLTHVNKNCSKLDVAPGNLGGTIEISPNKNFPYTIINEAKTIAENENDRLHVNIEDNKYIIKGTLSKSTGPVTIAAVANDNLSQVKYYLEKQLANQGVVLEGKILFSSDKVKDAQTVASLPKNIKNLVSKAMKKSDNFMTDYFLAEFASKPRLSIPSSSSSQTNEFQSEAAGLTSVSKHSRDSQKSVGSFELKDGITEWDWAAAKLKEVVAKKFNVDLTKSELRDGSGISRQNLLTVNQFDSLLKAVAKSKNFELVKSILASPGDDSTLHERFENYDIYAKTGSLTGVSALIGYFYDSKKELHSFVVMANNFYQNRPHYRKLEEDIIKLVSK